MWNWLRCGCWCCGFGGFASSFLSLFVFLYVRVISTLGSGYVRAPLPYRLVNAGLFDYKKKKKKKTVKKDIEIFSCLYPSFSVPL